MEVSVDKGGMVNDQGPEDKSVREILKKRKPAFEAEQRERETGKAVIFKVHPYLRGLKSDLFDSTVVSLGLFHSFGKSHPDFLGTHSLKVDVVLQFLEEVKKTPEDWDGVSGSIVPDPLGMKKLYDGYWLINVPPENVRSSLAADAIFLTCFLLYFLHSPQTNVLRPLTRQETNKIFERHHSTINERLFKDVIKLENQLPLELIRNVLIVIFQGRAPTFTEDSCRTQADLMMKRICFVFLLTLRKRFPHFGFPRRPHVEDELEPPRDTMPPTVFTELHNCQHLLHCLAQVICDVAKKTQVGASQPSLPANSESAVKREWYDTLKGCRTHLYSFFSCASGSDRSQQPSLPANSESAVKRDWYDTLERCRTHLYSFFSCASGSDRSQRVSPRPFDYCPTASKLRQHGVKFQGRTGFHPEFKKHTFWPWGATLFLPVIAMIDSSTEGQWKNVLAFEESFMTDRTEDRAFMAYLQFMELLVKNEEDVFVLRTGENPVIKFNALENDKAAADLFSSVTGHHILLTRCEVWSSVKAEVSEYSNGRLQLMRSAIREAYSHRPWLPMTFVVALIYLALQFLQTLYTIKSFKHC